jgi:cytochrome c oxidase subunit IV
MSAAEKHHIGYVTIWVWLVALLVAGVGLIALPASKTVVVSLIFIVAVAKAALVVRHYMHLRAQPLLIYAIMGIPVLLAIGMTLALMPDIAFRH